MAAATSRDGRKAGRATTDDATRAKAKAKAADPKPVAANEDGETVAEALGVVPGLLGGAPRQTLPVNANILGQLPWAFLPRRSYQSMDLTTVQPGAYSPQQLMELLADAWPEASQALWNIQRLAASEWSYEVRTPDNSEDDPEGKAELDLILGRVNGNWGGFDALINQWVMSTALQGACCGETIPTEEVDDVEDIVAVQPWSIFFQRDVSQRYIAFQWQPMTVAGGPLARPQSGSQTSGNQPGVFDPTAKAPTPSDLMFNNPLSHGGFRQLNEITFGYVPLDADVDDPYGRAPFAPVLQLVVWDMQIIKDLRQWSHVNAFGRIDVKVLAEEAAKMMPPMVAANKKERRLWFKKYLSDIQTAYNNLNPDDTYVHYDNVEVGAADASGKTFDVDKLIRVLERRIFRALKQLPILMGSNEGTTETWGTLQMEVYALGIANIQRTVASLIEKLLNVALRLRGHTSVVHFEFKTLRATDRMKEALADWQQAKNAAFKRDQGWISQDEASIEITGSEAVADAPDPDPVVAPLQPDAAAQHAATQTGDIPDEQAEDQASEGNDADEGDNADSDPKEAANPDPDAKKAAAKQSDEDDEEDGEKESDRWQRARHPIRGLDTPARRRAKAPSSDPAVNPAAVWQKATQLRADDDSADEDDQDAPEFTSAMTAFFLPEDAAEQLAVDGGEPPDQLHLTLTYLGETDDLPNVGKLKAAVAAFAADHEPFEGRVAGIGRFTSVPDGAPHPVYASVDSPALSAFREALSAAINGSGGASVDTTHGFTPHITLAYVNADDPTPIESVPALDLTFDTLTLALGGEYLDYPLGSSRSGRPKRNRKRAVLPATTYPHAGGTRSEDGEGKRHNHRPPSAKRAKLVRSVKADVADHFANMTLSRERLGHIIDTYRSSATANNKRTWPPLAEAVNIILDARRAPTPADVPRDGLATERLTEEQRQSILFGIVKMLESDFGDSNADLERIIRQARERAYNIGGNEGLAAIGLASKGEFELANQEILDQLDTTAKQQVQRIQATTRNRVGYKIADGLVAGDSEAQIGRSIQSMFDDWSMSRASSIASFETSSAYFGGTMALWSRCGIPNKVWVTSGDPDPGAGATGATPCRDNAYGSPVPIWDAFPSGDYEPPAHVDCECDVAPEGDPSEAAAASPWLGD